MPRKKVPPGLPLGFDREHWFMLTTMAQVRAGFDERGAAFLHDFPAQREWMLVAAVKDVIERKCNGAEARDALWRALDRWADDVPLLKETTARRESG